MPILPKDSGNILRLALPTSSDNRIQVNLCQKLLFLHQLTHNMTTDCLLNYKFNKYVKIPSSNLGRTCCVQKLVLTFRTIFVHNMFSPCSVKRRASDKDLPVQKTQRIILPSQISESVKVVEATGSSHLPLPAHLSHLAQPRKVHEIRLNIKNLYFTEIRA
jgi:hypothetical protein